MGCFFNVGRGFKSGDKPLDWLSARCPNQPIAGGEPEGGVVRGPVPPLRPGDGPVCTADGRPCRPLSALERFLMYQQVSSCKKALSSALSLVVGSASAPLSLAFDLQVQHDLQRKHLILCQQAHQLTHGSRGRHRRHDMLMASPSSPLRPCLAPSP